MKQLILPVIACLFSYLSQAQSFEFIDAPFDAVMQSEASWVDFDMDGDVDLFLTGHIYSAGKMVIKGGLYQNRGNNSWKRIGTNILPLSFAFFDWQDMDQDKFPDLLICGTGSDGNIHCKIYRNNGNGNFSEIQSQLPALTDGSVEWGDFDNDGWKDILICGKTREGVLMTQIYRNVQGKFEDISANLLPVSDGVAKWYDLDQDNDLDVLLFGSTYNNRYVGEIYLNNAGVFTPVNIKLPKLKYAAAACSDLNEDGVTDIVIAGENEEGDYYTGIFKNNGTGKISEAAILQGLRAGEIDVKDYNGDGKPDIVLCGESTGEYISTLYRNGGDFQFKKITMALPGVASGTVRWGDFDQDNDPDLLISGLNNCYDFITKLYLNQNNAPGKAVQPSEEENALAGNNMWKIHEINVPDKKYYYFVYSSCYCNPFDEVKESTHAFISNVHYAPEKYRLIENFNEIIRQNSDAWAGIDKGNRISVGYKNRKDAEEARQRILKEYTKEGFTVHYVEW